jgi:glycosyltransferase involved in cell wall biosynthesis
MEQGGTNGMRAVLVHDYLTQRGGAERVVLEMARAFDCDTIVTSAYLPDRTFPEFRDLRVVSLGLERVPLLRDPRYALPVIGSLFRRHRLEDADVVLCSSSGFAHQVSTTVPKVVYCHNPPRWLHQPGDYAGDLSRPASAALRLLRPHLLAGDRAGALGATGYLANSRNVADRIHRVYGLHADVVHPPRGLEPIGPVEAVPGLAPGFLLTVGRARGYKRTGLIMEAVAQMPDLTLVAVGSRSDEPWPPNVIQLTDVSDAQLRWLYREAAALLACSHEDFGLTPVEAFAFGTPVGATAEGGYLETCVEGKTGLWLDDSSREALQASIRAMVGRTWNRAAIKQHGQQWAPSSFHSGLVKAVERAVDTAAVTTGLLPRQRTTRADYPDLATG